METEEDRDLSNRALSISNVRDESYHKNSKEGFRSDRDRLNGAIFLATLEIIWKLRRRR